MEEPCFPQFSKLPAELRLCVWEAAVSSPSMHLFDLCLPASVSDDGNVESIQEWSRAQRAFSRTMNSGSTAVSEEAIMRYNKFKDTVFFDAHFSAESQLDNNSRLAIRSRRDPSMYWWKMALGAACFDAFAATSLTSVRAGGKNLIPPVAVLDDAVNTIYLPGPDRRIQYNNQTDVLHLCLLPQQGDAVSKTSATVTEVPSQPSPSHSACQSCSLQPKNIATQPEFTSRQDAEDGPMGLLDVQWSDDMAEALRNAHRVAIDASQTMSFVDMSGPLAAEEMAMLACTLHRGLELLYLVDYCPGRCQDCARPTIRAKNLILHRRHLYTRLNSPIIDDAECGEGISNIDEKNSRDPDVIWGVDRVYREVFDLEQLGWSERHPAFMFGQALGTAIRAQQLDAAQACQFRGVRVLVAEDE